MPRDNDDAYSQIETLEQRYAENPTGRVFALLADAYRKVGDVDRAEELILQGLENHPNYLSAYIVLGRINLDRERFAEAHEQFTKVLELDSENLIALKALGDLSTQTQRIDEARSWYEQMLQIDQYNEEARTALDGLDQIETEAAGTVEEVGASGEEVAEHQESGRPFNSAALDAAGGPDESVSLESVGDAAEAGAASAEINIADMDSWEPGLIEGGETDEEVELDWGGQDSGVVTETMAELYADQGLYEDAIKVYEELAAVRPYDERIQTRIRELTELLAGSGPSEPAADEAAIFPEPEEAWPAAEPEAEVAFPEPEEELTLPEHPEEIGVPGWEESLATPEAEEAVLSEQPPLLSESEEAVNLSEREDVVTLPDEAEEAPPSLDLSAEATDGASVFRVQLSEGEDLTEIDPFAGSFDALIMASQTGVSPDPGAGPLFPVAESGAGVVVAGPEGASEHAEFVAPPEDEAKAATLTEPAPAGPAAPGVAEPETTAAETIEDYLGRLLLYSPAKGGSPTRAERPEPQQTAVSGAAEADDSTASPASDEQQSDDLARFQAWLRGLKR